MQDITELHLSEIDAAMAEQNLALEAAITTFNKTIQTAQNEYAEKLTASREKAWSAIQERLRIWQGFGPTKLGDVATGGPIAVDKAINGPQGGEAPTESDETPPEPETP